MFWHRFQTSQYGKVHDKKECIWLELTFNDHTIRFSYENEKVIILNNYEILNTIDIDKFFNLIKKL